MESISLVRVRFVRILSRVERICARISAEVPSVSRVCYEITPKPVATIEFE
ncbi:hypothetical protein DW928_06855 [Firmicutes bacterium AM43-11BH]|nr:hypothetical protein DW928_06855 [Firmicutes bacterium AM43-11BH]